MHWDKLCLCTLIINVARFSSVDFRFRHPLPALVLVSVMRGSCKILLFPSPCYMLLLIFVKRGEKENLLLRASPSAELIPHKSWPLATPAFFQLPEEGRKHFFCIHWGVICLSVYVIPVKLKKTHSHHFLEPFKVLTAENTHRAQYIYISWQTKQSHRTSQYKMKTCKSAI